MVSNGRKAERSLARRKPRLDPRPRLLVVCEGIVTEQHYFEFFRREVRAAVDVVLDSDGGTPLTLVRRAIREKESADRSARRTGDAGSKYAEVWCVFDIDEHPYIEEAQSEAKRNSIQLAISNPCFELWLLLHFQEQTAYLERHHAQSACRLHVKDYEKVPDLEALKPKYETAVARAALLASRNDQDNEPGRNPSTSVHVLTERLRSLGQLTATNARRSE